MCRHSRIPDRIGVVFVFGPGPSFAPINSRRLPKHKAKRDASFTQNQTSLYRTQAQSAPQTVYRIRSLEILGSARVQSAVILYSWSTYMYAWHLREGLKWTGAKVLLEVASFSINWFRREITYSTPSRWLGHVHHLKSGNFEAAARPTQVVGRVVR